MIAARYIARGFVVYAATALVILLVLYLIFDFVEVYRILDARGGGLPLILRYIADRAASALWHVLPAAILLGQLLCLGALARRGELTAVYAAGIGPSRILLALLLTSAVASAALWWVGNGWMPGANQRVHEIFRSVLDKDKPRGREGQGHWLRAGHRFIHMRQMGEREARGITLIEVGKGFMPSRRIDAAALRWRKGRWELEDAIVRELRTGSPTRRHSRMSADLPLTPRQLRAGRTRPELLAHRELSDLIDWKSAQGLSTIGLRRALAERRSWPLLPLFLTLVAAPLGLAVRRATSTAASLGRALGVGAAYAAVSFVAQALGKAGTLSPQLAGWLPQTLLGACGLALCARMFWTPTGLKRR